MAQYAQRKHLQIGWLIGKIVPKLLAISLIRMINYNKNYK